MGDPSDVYPMSSPRFSHNLAVGDRMASTVKVLLIDASSTSTVLKTLAEVGPLGDYSWDHFTGYSPPIEVHATGLNLSNEAPVLLALEITNNDRNLQIPIDDLADGSDIQ